MALHYKHLFPRATQVAYLDTAAEGLPAPGCCDAFSEYCTAKMLGTPARVALQQMEDDTLESAARLLRTSSANITFLSSASEALYVLAGSIDWAAGDEVIISDIEFPSNILPWLRLRKLGVRVIVVPADKGALGWQQIAERISPRTRLVSVSLVSYRTGAYLTGVADLAAEVHRVGAFLAIDATQALGRCPVSIEGVDYLVASSFKWLMGPHGLGLVYLSPEFRDRLDPVSLGWYSVTNAFAPDRFETYKLKSGARCLAAGMPNFPSLVRTAAESPVPVGDRSGGDSWRASTARRSSVRWFRAAWLRSADSQGRGLRIGDRCFQSRECGHHRSGACEQRSDRVGWRRPGSSVRAPLQRLRRHREMFERSGGSREEAEVPPRSRTQPAEWLNRTDLPRQFQPHLFLELTHSSDIEADVAGEADGAKPSSNPADRLRWRRP